MGVAYNPAIVTDGLILCLDAGNSKSYPGSGTTWTDLSTSKNTGSLINSVGFSTNDLGALTFDGINQSVNITSNISVSGITNYSISIWINLDSSSNGVDTRFFWRGNYGVLIFKGDDNKIYYYLRNSTLVNTNMGTTVSSLIGNWNNIVGTYDGTTKKLYVNGILLNSESMTGSIVNDSPTLIRLGGYSSAGFYTPCKISSCLEYNRTLSTQEIQQNFNAFRGRYRI